MVNLSSHAYHERDGQHLLLPIASPLLSPSSSSSFQPNPSLVFLPTSTITSTPASTVSVGCWPYSEAIPTHVVPCWLLSMPPPAVLVHRVKEDEGRACVTILGTNWQLRPCSLSYPAELEGDRRWRWLTSDLYQAHVALYEEALRSEGERRLVRRSQWLGVAAGLHALVAVLSYGVSVVAWSPLTSTALVALVLWFNLAVLCFGVTGFVVYKQQQLLLHAHLQRVCWTVQSSNRQLEERWEEDRQRYQGSTTDGLDVTPSQLLQWRWVYLMDHEHKPPLRYELCLVSTQPTEQETVGGGSVSDSADHYSVTP